MRSTSRTAWSTICVLTVVPLSLLLYLSAPTTATASPVSSSVSMIASPSCGTFSGFCFAPASVSLTVGATVTWSNTTGAPHTATSDAGLWDTAVVNAGQMATITFSTPGSFPYHCSIHADMHGTVVVQSLFSTASSQQYALSNSDGSLWHDLDAARLSLTITPGADASATIAGNADLWTANAGFNQDLGIDVN